MRKVGNLPCTFLQNRLTTPEIKVNNSSARKHLRWDCTTIVRLDNEYGLGLLSF